MTNEQALKKATELVSSYDQKAGWNFDSNLEHLNTITKHIPKTVSVFDAGCGLGILALALTFLGYKVEAGDKKIIEDLRKVWNNYGLNVQKIDILKDSPSKKYGAVVSIATIEHQTNPRLFLSKLKEMVGESGYIYVATPNLAHLLNRIRFLFGRPPISNIKEFYGEEDFEGHFREYTLDELKQMFQWSKIKIIEAKNRQETRPKIDFKSFRDVYVNLFRFFAYFLPGAGDANIILGRK